MSEAAPSRPDLTAMQSKPDIVDRLRMIAIDLPESATARAGIETLVEAAVTIKALRDTCGRRLAMINDLKRELANLRPEESR